MDDVEKNMSDHDLLLVLYTLQKEMVKQLDNHLRHHTMINIVALSAVFIGISSFVVGLILLYVKTGVV